MNGVKLCFSIANLLRLIDTKQEKTEKRLKGIAKGIENHLVNKATKRVTKKAIRHDGHTLQRRPSNKTNERKTKML